MAEVGTEYGVLSTRNGWGRCGVLYAAHVACPAGCKQGESCSLNDRLFEPLQPTGLLISH